MIKIYIEIKMILKKNMKKKKKILMKNDQYERNKLQNEINYNEKQLNVENMKKKNEIYRNFLEYELKEKEKKIEDNMRKKIEEQEEKKNIIKEKEKKKEIIKKQFDDMTKKNENEIDIEKIKELFPDDENLHRHLDDIKKEYEEKEKNIIENYTKNKELRHLNSQKLIDKMYKKMK